MKITFCKDGPAWPEARLDTVVRELVAESVTTSTFNIVHAAAAAVFAGDIPAIRIVMGEDELLVNSESNLRNWPRSLLRWSSILPLRIKYLLRRTAERQATDIPADVRRITLRATQESEHAHPDFCSIRRVKEAWHTGDGFASSTANIFWAARVLVARGVIPHTALDIESSSNGHLYRLDATGGSWLGERFTPLLPPEIIQWAEAESERAKIILASTLRTG